MSGLLNVCFYPPLSTVIQAAHCFYDESSHQVQSAFNFAVAAGKVEREWKSNETHVQRSKVDSIKLADRYLGARGNFAQDIAIVKLSKPFELTSLVRPICIDWDNTYERQQLRVGHLGKVTYIIYTIYSFDFVTMIEMILLLLLLFTGCWLG